MLYLSEDRYALEQAVKILENAAGNFYINDKPTGAVVGQQPFGGARASGTNDKAGSKLNLYRWVFSKNGKRNICNSYRLQISFLRIRRYYYNLKSLVINNGAFLYLVAMKRIAFILLLCLQSAASQSYVKTNQSPLSVDQFIGYDSYDSIYTITDMVLRKENTSGVFLFTDFQLGNITSVDIINPFNVVVFYADTNTTVLLDNKLSLIEQINFNLLTDVANISSVSNAGGNKLWLFNADSQQLELYNYRNNTKNSISLPIAEILTDQTSDFNYNYILTPKRCKGLYRFWRSCKEHSVSRRSKNYNI